MATLAQSAVQAFPSPLFAHPGLSSSAAALAPGEGFLKNSKLRIELDSSALLYFLQGLVLFSSSILEIFSLDKYVNSKWATMKKFLEFHVLCNGIISF